LNLTYEVREEWSSTRATWLRRSLELDASGPLSAPPLEAQLIDLADEIAYNTADLDDAFFRRPAGARRCGRIAFRNTVAILRGHRNAVSPGPARASASSEGLRCLIDALVTGLIEGTAGRAREAAVADADEVQAFSPRLAAFTAEAAETSPRLKQFLYPMCNALRGLGARTRRRSMTMIGELFRFFLDHPDRLPPPYCQQALAEPAPRVVCDYIAGMTTLSSTAPTSQTVGAG